MNQKKKGLIILAFAAGFIYSGLLTFPEVSPTSQKFSIVTIDITYNIHKTKEPTDNYYTIERLNGNYYSNGEWINPQLVYALAESFTDFYESKKYERLSTTKKEPSLIAEITLENKNSIILKSGSRIHCFMPWNIEYNGKLYVQYSGKIPSALLQILIELDREKWYP